MAIKVYSNKSGTNITHELDGGKMSWHSNAKSNGEALFSYKTAEGQYVKTYEKDGWSSSQQLKDKK